MECTLQDLPPLALAVTENSSATECIIDPCYSFYEKKFSQKGLKKEKDNFLLLNLKQPPMGIDNLKDYLEPVFLDISYQTYYILVYDISYKNPAFCRK
jgi:hypothetical protein